MTLDVNTPEHDALMEEFDRRDLGDGAMFCGSDIEQVKSAIRKGRGER